MPVHSKHKMHRGSVPVVALCSGSVAWLNKHVWTNIPQYLTFSYAVDVLHMGLHHFMFIFFICQYLFLSETFHLLASNMVAGYHALFKILLFIHKKSSVQ